MQNFGGTNKEYYGIFDTGYVVTLLHLCTVRRILVAINIARGRGGGGGSTNENESLNKVMETGYRCVE